MVTAPKDRPVTIRFSEEDVELMKRLSEQEDTPAAAIVRRALREYAERHLKSEPKRKR